MEKLEFKGTKNEWFIDQEESHRMTNGVYCNVISTVNTIDIADVYGDDEESQANAKLISASPDLLEALQHMIPVFEQLASFRNINVDNLECYKKARKAIEKALK